MSERDGSEKPLYIGFIAIALLAFYLGSLYNYLLFHSLIEIVTIAIGFGLFMLAWNTRRYLTNGYLRLLGIGYAFIALIDLFHTLVYKGMNIFPAFDANLPTQLWIAARSLQAATLCVAPFFVERRVDNRAIFGGFVITVSLLAAAVYSGNFPDCYIEGKGLTAFKIASEYVITAALSASLYLLYKKRTHFDGKVFLLIASSIACTAFSEMFFTSYLSVYGPGNMVGHLFKLVAFCLIYEAILVTGLKMPFDLIFRELKQAQDTITEAHNTLEEQVKDRTRELRASEERCRSLIRKVQTAIVLHDGEGRVLTSNPLAQDLLGISEDHPPGRNLIDPQWRFLREDCSVMPANEYPVNLVLSTRRPLRGYVTGVSRPDREDVTWVLVNAEPEYDDKGEIALVIVSLVDITERKHVEEALLVSEKRYRMAQAAGHVGSWEYDLQTGRFWGSDEAKRIYGLDPARTDFSTGEIECHIPQRELVHQALTDLIEKGKPYNLEFEINPGNCAEHRIISSIAELQRDEQGEPLRVTGVVQDVTERSLAEEELSQATRLWERTFNAVPDLVAILDDHFRIVKANKAMTDRLGCAPEETAGQFCYKVVHGTDSPPSFCPHALTLKDSRLHETEIMEDHLGGAFIVSTSPILDSSRQMIGSVHVARDITEHKKAEEERRRLETQLAQSQKMEAIGTLAGSIAHDFNNILTVILGYCALLQMNMDESDPQRAYIDQIYDSSEKASHLTKSLLAFSRKQKIEPESHRINQIITDTVRLVGRLLTEDIELKTVMTPENPLIMADIAQIDQVLINLCVNARDAMPEGGLLRIETQVAALDDEFVKAYGYGSPGVYSVVSVTDNGIGMDKELQEHIFEPFFTTKEVGKGTGLGLASVYGIVKQHDGYITVSSEPAQGSTFRMYFPVIHDEKEQIEFVPKEIKGGNETILVTEDNPLVRGLITDGLQGYGYSVVPAENGEEAVRAFAANKDRIDLIIMDVVMPKKSGREAYEQIRTIRADARILFISGYTSDMVLEKGIVDGAYDFIAKPILLNDLLLKVRQILDRGSLNQMVVATSRHDRHYGA